MPPSSLVDEHAALDMHPVVLEDLEVVEASPLLRRLVDRENDTIVQQQITRAPVGTFSA